MKKGILRQISISVLVIFCMMVSLSLQPVKGASLLDEREKLTEDETDADYSEDINTPRTRSNFLNLGNVRITKISSNECSVFGLTEAYLECDNLYLELALEQKTNGSYNTYKSWSFTEVNASNLSRNISVIVPKNHYYRVVGYHAAKEGTVKESTTTQTKGVWIGD